jgi:hypothetical protein
MNLKSDINCLCYKKFTINFVDFCPTNLLSARFLPESPWDRFSGNKLDRALSFFAFVHQVRVHPFGMRRHPSLADSLRSSPILPHLFSWRAYFKA